MVGDPEEYTYTTLILSGYQAASQDFTTLKISFPSSGIFAFMSLRGQSTGKQLEVCHQKRP